MQLKVSHESFGQWPLCTIELLSLPCRVAAFCTGTAAELVPIARLATGADEEPFEKVFPHGQNLPGGPITTTLLKLLRQVMIGEKTSKNTQGWLRDPYASPEVFCKE